MFAKILVLLCSLLIIQPSFAALGSQWANRTIYQLLTDRFGGGSGNCYDLSYYCGGTWNGIADNLDYIQGMGFDAIWISPIPKNFMGGYHGYWQIDFTSVNDHFGESSDLKNLVEAAHARDMWVMLDVVGNHVGPVGYDYSSVVPFNQGSYYHDCSICPSNCQIQDWTNQPEVEWCRLAGLPDLDQSNSFVNETLLKWIHDTIDNYGFDGIRIDTTPEVDKDFWYSYVQSANVFSIGEVFNGNIQYVSSYAKPQGPLDATLSYPLFFTLRDVFAYQNSMYELQSINQQYASASWDVNLLGTFVDNHDNARFLNEQSDTKLYENAIAYTLMSSGIPIIYYGTEQGFNGGNDPNNRECLWPTNYNTQSQLYEFIQLVNTHRKQAQVWKYPQVQRYADNSFYAFTRGNTFVATTNGGSGQAQIVRTITYHPYSNGTKLCNIFYDGDCVTVTSGSFDVYLDNGETKIFYPAN